MKLSEVMNAAFCNRMFTGFANATSRYTGRPITFAICIGLIVVWAATGPIFHYSDTWQLIINTSTTIVTFLMVFLIQNTQNRDNAALQAKLDELIRVTEAQNGFIGIEKLTDQELEQILEDFEEHAEPLPLSEKAELINDRVEAVVDRKAAARKARAAPAARAPAKAKPAAKTPAKAKPASKTMAARRRPAPRKAS
jgi:low affinity Fe/Cu permease